tara:strand:- start:343 stop:798 length:456 start_codon:yes stop_codon:yes gene_type:complete
MGVASEELNEQLQGDVEQVIESVQIITGITYTQILSTKRSRHLVDARKILVNVMRKHLRLTCYQVGKVIDKDHSSVIYYEKQHPIHMGETEYRRLYSAVSGTFLISKSVRDEERLQDQFRNLQRRTRVLLNALEGQEESLNMGMREVKNSV